MTLSTAHINEFKEIYSRVCGVTLTNDEAEKTATTLIELFKAIYRPIKSGDASQSNYEKQSNYENARQSQN